VVEHEHHSQPQSWLREEEVVEVELGNVVYLRLLIYELQKLSLLVQVGQQEREVRQVQQGEHEESDEIQLSVLI
jgi:hypothetical protein